MTVTNYTNESKSKYFDEKIYTIVYLSTDK